MNGLWLKFLALPVKQDDSGPLRSHCLHSDEAMKPKEVEPRGSVMNPGRLWRLLCVYGCDDNFDLSSSTETVPSLSNNPSHLC